MRAFLLAFGFAWASLTLLASEMDADLLSFKVYPQTYRFSTSFEFLSGKASLGSATKSSFHLRTHYDIYDASGFYEGVGINRAFSLGTLFSWACKFDVYDEADERLGGIYGQIATGSRAKFNFYNGEGNMVGVAYLDRAFSGFTIYDPLNEKRILTTLKRVFILDQPDHWNVVIYDETAIDLRLLKVFAAFAVDSQGAFKEDN